MYVKLVTCCMIIDYTVTTNAPITKAAFFSLVSITAFQFKLLAVNYGFTPHCLSSTKIMLISILAIL